MFKHINLETWDRKELWDNFMKEPVILSFTVPINITKLYKISKRKKIKLSACIIYAISRVVNRIDNFRVYINEKDEIGCFDRTSPKLTVIKKGTDIFSTILVDYEDDFLTFYKNYLEWLEKYNQHDANYRFKNSNSREDYFRISYLPSIAFTSLVSLSVANKHSISCRPFFAIGKYTKKIGKVTLPVSISISHLAVDGYHISRFFDLLRAEVNELSNEIKYIDLNNKL